METKTCKDCKEEKTTDNYYKNKQNGKEYYLPYCKPCHYKRTKDSAVEFTREKLYGVSIEEYQKMLESQSGKCAICLGSDRNRSLSVHAGHNALLCQSCKMALAGFKCDTEIIKRAITYLGG